MSSASPLSMPPQPAAAAQPSSVEKKVYEPSMEEILASIRRIIADDQSLPGRGTPSEAFASPLSPLPQEPAPVPQAVEPQRPEPAVGMTPAAHGSVAAPQFAMPHPVAARVEPVAEPAPAPPPAAAAPTSAAVAPTHVEAPVAAAYVAPSVPQPHQPAPEPKEAQVPDAAYESVVEVAAFSVEEEEAHVEESELYDAPISPPEPEPEPVEPPHAADLPPEAEAVVHAEPSSPAADLGAGLFSAATDSSVSSAFNMLAASRLADNSDELMNLAREMIRPLLRTWIDDNLPSMVERMVRAEIERVARGGR